MSRKRFELSIVLTLLAAAMLSGAVFAGVEPVTMFDGGGGESAPSSTFSAI